LCVGVNVLWVCGLVFHCGGDILHSIFCHAPHTPLTLNVGKKTKKIVLVDGNSMLHHTVKVQGACGYPSYMRGKAATMYWCGKCSGELDLKQKKAIADHMAKQEKKAREDYAQEVREEKALIKAEAAEKKQKVRACVRVCVRVRVCVFLLRTPIIYPLYKHRPPQSAKRPRLSSRRAPRRSPPRRRRCVSVCGVSVFNTCQLMYVYIHPSTQVVTNGKRKRVASAKGNKAKKPAKKKAKKAKA
jgi:hypothetical protein